MLKPGDAFERYTVEALLGQGGMGAVYRAHDGRLDRRVALKVLSDPFTAEGGTEARARMLREARAAAALDHPNAVAIYDVGEARGDGDDSQPYIVMELVAGDTLRKWVGDESVGWRKRIGWMLDVARALGAAHDKGLVHRDIKPENVMVRRDGVVKVLDFGIARRAASQVDPTAPTEGSSLPTLTAQGVQVGTPLYMAPEQIKGDPVDGRTDQFAWAVCALELLTGRLPWRAHGGSLGVVASILTDDPPAAAASAPDLPAGVDAALRRALSKRPADRFASMEALVAEIERHLDGAPAAAPAPAPRRAPGADSGAALERYSTEQMRDILQRALERQQAEASGFTRDELLEAAREVGVDEKAITAAVREVEASRNAPGQLAERRRRELRSFLRHLASYVVVNTFLYFMSSGWNRLVLLGWGIGLAMHAVNVVFPKEPDPRKTKRVRREEPAPAVEEGAKVLLDATTERARRLRVGAGADGARADSTAREVEAEAEAAAAEKAGAAPRRAKR